MKVPKLIKAGTPPSAGVKDVSGLANMVIQNTISGGLLGLGTVIGNNVLGNFLGPIVVSNVAGAMLGGETGKTLGIIGTTEAVAAALGGTGAIQ